MKENRKLLKEVLKEIRHDMTDEEVLNLLADSKISENTSRAAEKYTIGQRAENDYKVNLKTEIMIEDLYTLTVVCFLVVRKMICPSTMTL